MQYDDGTIITLGDKVLISGQYIGIVVADIDGDKYSKTNPKNKWAYLQNGIIIDTDFAGLVHYQQETLINETLERK